jgi:hypothetical protein
MHCDSTTAQQKRPITTAISRSATHLVQRFRPVPLQSRSLSRSLASHTFRRISRRDRCQSRTRAKRYGLAFRAGESRHRPSEQPLGRNLARQRKHKIDTIRHPSESKSREVPLLSPLHAHRSRQLEVFRQSFAMYAGGQVPPVRFEHEHPANRRTRSLPNRRSPIIWRPLCLHRSKCSRAFSLRIVG